MPTPEEIQASIALFDADVQRFNDILLGDENTEVEMSDTSLRPSIAKQFTDRFDADGAALISAKYEAVAAASLATGAQTAAETARDAAIIGSGVYATEAAGRASVADGEAFKVQGSGDVAAYEYRRIDSSSSTLIATYPSASALSFVERSTDSVYVNGQEVMYSVVDSAGRALAYIGMDGVIYGKLPIAASNGIALTKLADGTYTLKLDAAAIDPSYGAVDYLAAIVDSAGRKLFTINLDGTLIGKLGVSASGGVSASQLSTGVYNFALDPALIDTNYGATDYLAAIVDSSGRMLFSVGLDGTITGKITNQEVVDARGGQTDLNTRLSRNFTNYGLPSEYIWGEWFLRETRMRLRKRAMSESVQLNIALIGDSWTHNRDRYSKPVSTTLKSVFGDAGAGWTGFAWGFGGTSDVWSGGNGNANSSDVGVTLSANWTVAYYTTASPDLGGISTSTAGAKVTTSYNGSGNISAVKLFYTAGSGVLRYRWNGGSWTTLDISSGSGSQNESLSSVPTSTWTLEIENVSGTTVIHGIDIQKTDNGVRVHKLGSTGSSTANWTAVDATQWKNSLIALSPNLVCILLGTNDQAAITPTVFKTKLQTLITRVKEALPVADITIIMPCENQRTNTYAMSLYAANAYELAYTNKCAFLNLQHVFGDNAADYAFGSSRPWFASDLIHPDPNTGGRVITDAVYRLLTSV